MATVKLKFRPSMVADRPGTIIYLITHRRTVRQITTEYRVFSDEWDEKQSRLVTINKYERAETVRIISRRIHRDMARLNTIIENFDSKRQEYSSEDIISEFWNTSNANTLFKFMNDVIERLRQLQHIGTAKNYHAALCSFKRFRDNEDITLRDIDQFMMEDYQAYLKSAGLSSSWL